MLVLIPDATRTLPLPLLFHLLVDVLHDVGQLDFLVALGTHQPLSEDALCQLVGITPAERAGRYAHVGLYNHAWDDPAALAQVGALTHDQVKQLAGDHWHPSLSGDVPVRLNRRAVGCDQILIVGPTFPHEIVGMSGGAKYLFPGISGPEVINATHWLGALINVLHLIGYKSSPVRDIVHAAAALVPTPVTLTSLVTEHDGLAGVFVGDLYEAFSAAADLSAETHITWIDRPFQRVLSAPAVMYDELWTAAKAMYKLEPAVADGGEIVIYAPHLDRVSLTHGRYIKAVGYHVLDYLFAHWDEVKDVPRGVLAHCTHLAGVGSYLDGQERRRIKVTLATQISAEECAALNLGYCDPATIDLSAWQGREDEGILYVPKAGEMLYRVRG
ncbi:MAG: DUF2088 domain-containing protein [Anaerolineae bacterium]|nr:DUF2088 domain-containing protein [Anaerolineae bacterium]